MSNYKELKFIRLCFHFGQAERRAALLKLSHKDRL